MSVKLSGYEFNGITPFNFVTPMPLVLSDRVKDLEYIWFGGGHKEVKLRMDVQELIKLSQEPVYVTDVTY